MFRLIKSWWYSRLRKIDLRIFWPSCKKYARDLDHAKAAFAVHAFMDEAWLSLGKEKIYEEIDRLE